MGPSLVRIHPLDKGPGALGTKGPRGPLAQRAQGPLGPKGLGALWRKGNLDKSWEAPGGSWGNPGGILREILGNHGKNPREILGKSWGKSWGNPGGNPGGKCRWAWWGAAPLGPRGTQGPWAPGGWPIALGGG